MKISSIIIRHRFPSKLHRKLIYLWRQALTRRGSQSNYKKARVTTNFSIKSRPCKRSIESLFCFNVVASLQRGLSIDTLVETSWLVKPPHHVKVGFIEENCMCIIYPQFTVSNFYEFLSEEQYLKIRPYYIKKERMECYICKIGSNTYIKLLKIDLLFSLEIFRVAIPWEIWLLRRNFLMGNVVAVFMYIPYPSLKIRYRLRKPKLISKKLFCCNCIILTVSLSKITEWNP